MKHFQFKPLYLLILAVILVIAVPIYGARGANSTSKINAFDFRNGMRKLWEDHITWTRLFIVSDVANLPDTSLVAQRLLQNQVDIGKAIKPFYGTQAGDQLAALLKDHILLAAQILDAAKKGDTAAFSAAKTQWYDNANQIAAFLNAANPKFWPLDHMQQMMKSHLDLTLAEASAHLSGNWQDSINEYDLVHNEILSMADMLSLGIINQFPNMFTNVTK